MGSIFITGISGYIGRRLLLRLECLPYEQIYCLCRNPNAINGSLNNKFYPIQGGIEDIGKYSPYLANCDTVVHLAAQTGKASKEEYFKVNTKGTEHLLNQCKNFGIKKFLHVSTIAAKYTNKKYYYYAQSKEQGECAVIGSGLRYTIVRPTIVIGENSANWKGVSTLAKVPIIPLLGEAATQIQPIYVDDLVDCLIEIIEKDIFNNKIFEVGGSERIAFETFLKQIHFEYYGKNAKVLKLPLSSIQKVLSTLESYVFSILPITAGQLSAFCNDGTVQPNSLASNNTASMKGVNEMVKLVINLEKSRARFQTLDKECKVYAAYLVGREPTNYVLGKYRDAHKYSNLLDDNNAGLFDKFLLNISINHPFFVRMADSYTTLFHKNALFRNKLVLLVAIMESTAPTYSFFESTDSSNMISLGFKLSLGMVWFAISLLGAIIIFSPIRLAYSLTGRPTAEGKLS